MTPLSNEAARLIGALHVNLSIAFIGKTGRAATSALPQGRVAPAGARRISGTRSGAVVIGTACW
jgi:hypothetical protein